ncbi:MAG: hydroxyacid dehydrogenase [Thermoprotei archaeon]|nr:MAG: hydroxyacid dehydrogenase [Thermoprotei archaeon]
MPKLVIASASYGIHAREALERLTKIFDEIRRTVFRTGMREEEVLREIGDADAVILGGGGPITRGVMEKASNLKIIARHGIGLDNVDVEAATELGIVVTYCRHTGEEISVAEHAIALMLACARRLVEADKCVREGRWRDRVKLVGVELRGKVLGIIGLGAIGREVAKIASKGLGMKILAYDPYVPDRVFKELGVEKVGLDELLEKSDVITIHAPLTPETRGMLSRERLARVKPGAILVNTARGAIVDEEALYEMVVKGRIFYAGIDVFSEEPPVRSPLRKLERAILTPHIAAFTREGLYRMDMAIAEDLARFFRGERPLHVANPEVFERRVRASWLC